MALDGSMEDWEFSEQLSMQQEIESLRQQLAECRNANLIKYGTTHPEVYKTELDLVKEKLAECERERGVWKESYGVLESQYLEQLATVTAERDELVASLKELMKYTPRTKYIGGVENCYCVPTGTALCKVIDACEAAIAKLGAGEMGERS